ncbi:MAG TPA: PilZ domain-containing protein [Polyangiaceae bacterium]|nr:PilZ domain-containing protein [Polyangiaceae bacterium]
MQPPSSKERRRHPRGYVAAFATVFVEETLLAKETRVGEYVVRDLSAGGAQLVNGPPLEPGMRCRVHLEIAGLGKLRVPAVTVRAAHTPYSNGSIGVMFTHLRPDVEDGLQQLVLQELERATMPSVLVACSDIAAASAVADALAEIGERPLLALTALEALVWLADPNTRVELALLGEHLMGGSPAELAATMAQEFKHIRCVTFQGPLSSTTLSRLLDAYVPAPAQRPSQIALQQ